MIDYGVTIYQYAGDEMNLSLGWGDCWWTSIVLTNQLIVWHKQRIIPNNGALNLIPNPAE
ncbi:MAG: hypothetical protein K0R36_2334 [Chryseobacterium sp.]|jgi:hypothetical protein|nr:hypothetical protein [Chryseobacterium sp.]